MARRYVNTTKHEIIQTAARLFLERGYSATTPKLICDELDISTGNLTYYFPTKEHLLAVLAKTLCDFQWKMMNKETDEGNTSVMAVCLEMMILAAMCEESEIARDFYLSLYTSPMCLEIIRKNDTERSKQVYREYCPEWTELQFVEAETIVSGIEYATMMTTSDSASLEIRLAGALESILSIYNIPKDIRRMKIEKVLKMDYRSISRRVLSEFKDFVEQTNEAALEELMNAKKDG